jgi:hypothetical protein
LIVARARLSALLRLVQIFDQRPRASGHKRGDMRDDAGSVASADDATRLTVQNVRLGISLTALSLTMMRGLFVR